MEDRQRDERKEEHARVLDFMASGKAFSTKREPIAQLIGETWFTLLEAIAKPGVSMSLRERVYIGNGEREKVLMIKMRINHEELTQTAKNEMRAAIDEIIADNEKRFVEVFNNAGPLNIREHALELLPGVGKRHLESILKARSERKFESFADIAARLPLLQHPARLVAERVMLELNGGERFHMFTKPYIKRPWQA